MFFVPDFITPAKPTPAPQRRLTAAPTITVALTGNPNSGKTTIFNNLTGARQRVGNYGGVTVETKQGRLTYGSYRINVVDLPGTYSLSAYSPDEMVARDYLIEQKPDVIVDIVDGSNLERNLYLAVQLKEMKLPLVVALNMADELKNQHLHVDLEKLSRDLGAPVIPTIGTQKIGMKRLLEKIIEVAQGAWTAPVTPPVYYGPEIENELEKIEQLLNQNTLTPVELPHDAQPPRRRGNPTRWLALKLLENDSGLLKNLKSSPAYDLITEQLEISKKRIVSLLGDDPEVLMAEQRYGHVHGIYRTVVRRNAEARLQLSDQIDKVLTNRLLGLPIFAALMYITFWLVFTVGEYPMGWIETAIDTLSAKLTQLWPAGSAPMLRSLVLDGIIAGVGNVLVFLPNIMLLFMAIALLEDTGYMARAAFIMDRLMKWVGLHGKSFIPMITGFGCTVPAIMGTRILDNRADRLTTILILPLMSCGARLPIYLLIIPAFFPPAQAATIMYGMYLIGIVLAFFAARLLRSSLFKSAPSPFVMELPPYRIPTVNAIFLHMWQRSRLYLRKAGTLILGISIIMWALTSYPQIPPAQLEKIPAPQQGPAQVAYSFAGRLGRTLEPVLDPMGFDWKIGTALIGAFAAKEVFVAQLGIVYAVEQDHLPATAVPDKISDSSPAAVSEQTAEPSAASERVKKSDQQLETLRQHLREHYSPLVGFCIMLFCLIASPCMATVAVTRRESGAWRWALLQFGGLTALAYILTVAVYQAGNLLRIGIT